MKMGKKIWVPNKNQTHGLPETGWVLSYQFNLSGVIGTLTIRPLNCLPLSQLIIINNYNKYLLTPFFGMTSGNLLINNNIILHFSMQSLHLPEWLIESWYWKIPKCEIKSQLDIVCGSRKYPFLTIPPQKIIANSGGYGTISKNKSFPTGWYSGGVQIKRPSVWVSSETADYR